ncbi:hypothetical protein [Veronia pacifica]|uniref:Uncharacterized protein n=1 Tax=Veronia pacifica TaxID=1080227 RepID=A0A1C3EDB0_9GAMM|nr:hypothetical protein [Veronia pacifica]ODA31223.1 hypothetical protein A8L45_17840 [Veronia pacifica]
MMIKKVTYLSALIFIQACGGGSGDGETGGGGSVTATQCFPSYLGEVGSKLDTVSDKTDFQGTEIINSSQSVQRKITYQGISDVSEIVDNDDANNLAYVKINDIEKKLTLLANKDVEGTSEILPSGLEINYTIAQGTTLTSENVTLRSTGSPDVVADISVTFQGIESISIPAGTFNACRFDITFSQNGVSRQFDQFWYNVGNGIELRSTSFSFGVAETEEIRSAILNGNTLEGI